MSKGPPTGRVIYGKSPKLFAFGTTFGAKPLATNPNGDPQPLWAAYFPRNWNPLEGGPVVVICHGTLGAVASLEHREYYQKFVRGAPLADEVGGSTWSGKFKTGPLHRYQADGSEIPTLPNWSIAETPLECAEKFGCAIIAPRIMTHGGETNVAALMADLDNIRSILTDFAQRNWIKLTNVTMHGHSAGGVPARTFAMASPALIATPVRRLVLGHTNFEPSSAQANFEINKKVNDAYYYNYDNDTRVVSYILDGALPLTVGLGGSFDFRTDVDAAGIQIFCISSSNNTDGTSGSTTYAEDTREAVTNYLAAAGIAAYCFEVTPAGSEDNGLADHGDGHFGGDYSVNGPSLGTPAGTANRCYWPHWLHEDGVAMACRIAVATDDDFTNRFERAA